ncbi:MAG: hypothetical protein HFH26_13320 [Clostridiaceae bacterium]|nr:hypothetical protein [Clostridiaceae bacterium]
MSKFDFMGFGYDGGSAEMFVAHAKKHSTAETIELCVQEFEYLFQDHKSISGQKIKGLRKPAIADVQDAHCAFRFGVSPEWPDGCYTFVDEKAYGAFPVHVIDFARLEKLSDSDTNLKGAARHG